jgi:hypothetical protein
LNKEQLETSGISVDIGSEMPTKEMSERVFSSIFDILNVKFSTSAFIPQYDQIISSSNWQKKGKNTEATLSIDGFKNIAKIEGVEYFNGDVKNNTIVNYQVRNNAAFPAKQSTEIQYQEDSNNLTVSLVVYTAWYSKSSHSIMIMGKRVSVPTIKTESETEIFNVSAQAPQTFPKTEDIKTQVTYYNNSYNPHSIVSLSNAWGIVQEDYTYNGSEASHYKLIGEVSKKSNGLSYVNYSELSTWKTTNNQISGYGNDLYIPGHFQKEKLNISVQTPYETVQIKEVNVTEIPDESSAVLNPQLWTFIGTLSLLGFLIYKNWKRIVPKW